MFELIASILPLALFGGWMGWCARTQEIRIEGLERRVKNLEILKKEELGEL